MSLDLLFDGLVDDLSGDCLHGCNVLDSFDWDVFDDSLFLLNVVDDLLLNDVGDVLSDVLNGVVVSDLLLMGNQLALFDGLVFHHGLLLGDKFGSLDAFVLDNGALSGHLFGSLYLLVLHHAFLDGDLFSPGNGLVLHDALLVGDVLDSAGSLRLLLLDDLDLLLLDDLDWLLLLNDDLHLLRLWADHLLHDLNLTLWGHVGLDCSCRGVLHLHCSCLVA